MTAGPAGSPEKAAFWLARSALFAGLDRTVIDDFSSELDLVHLEAGETLMREGDPADAMYTVIGGRLHVFVTGSDEAESLIGEIGIGESVGEMALLTDEPRSATVRAARNTELVQVTRAAFERLVAEHPSAVMDLARMMVERLTRVMHRADGAGRPRALVLVPLDEVIPIGDVADALGSSLASFGPVRRVDRERFDAEFGSEAAEGIDGLDRRRLAVWHSDQEAGHRFVLFVADPHPTAWTRHCVGQADRIVLIGRAEAAPEPSAVESTLREPGGRQLAPQELVLLHRDSSRMPAGTSRWLDGRNVVRHLHVALDRPADFGRAGRLLAGEGVGVVLGGGGARGFAHIGVLRALEEAAIPIDVIGGVSMGSIVAAQHAMGYGYDEMIRRNRSGIVDGKLSRDVTLPLVSLNSGRRFRRALRDFYGSTSIEDLWIPFFCVSCNLSAAVAVTHRSGSLWRAVNASNAAPGLLPPVAVAGELLVDGGLVNNEPGDIAKEMCRGPVIVVNVSPSREMSVDSSLEELPPTWRVLRQRFDPRRRPPKLPGITSLIMRSMMVGSRHKSLEVEQAADYYLRPPIDRFRVDDYGAIDEIVDVGYEYARTQVAAWPIASQR